MSLHFGNRSQKNLKTIHPDLRRVFERALSFGVMDFSIIEGARSDSRQIELHTDGKSQLDGVIRKSRHQVTVTNPLSEAGDILPYPAEVNGVNVWNDNQRWFTLNGLILAAAAIEGVDIRSGCDWDGDGNNADSNFNDFPHYELV